MKKRTNERADELRPEYDLRQLLQGGIRGKYAKRYHAGTNLVPLDPDVRNAFRDERAVNDALRLVIQLRKIRSRRAGVTSRRTAAQPGATGDGQTRAAPGRPSRWADREAHEHKHEDAPLASKLLL